MILFCKDNSVSPGERDAMDRAFFEIERPLLIALEQRLGHSVEREIVTPAGLKEKVRTSGGRSGVPIVVWFLRSSTPGALADDMKQIRAQFREIGEERLFVLLDVATVAIEISDGLDGLRVFRVPKKFELAGPNPTFWRVLNDLVEDIGRAIARPAGSAGPGVFIAPVPSELSASSGRLRRDLEKRGFRVVSGTESARSVSIDSSLAQTAISVHLFGNDKPHEAGERPDPSLDVFHLALAYAKLHPDFRVLGWIDALAGPERSLFSERILREALEFSSRAEVVQSTIEDFKSLLFDRLGRLTTAPPATGQSASQAVPSIGASENLQLYLIFDPRDAETVPPVTNFLRDHGIAVLLSEFPPDQTRLRAIHHENLRRCDAALIIYGGVQEQWVRMKQQDLLRSAALGRQKRLSAKGVFLCSNRTENKLRFSAPDLMVINGFESTSALDPFIQRLSAA